MGKSVFCNIFPSIYLIKSVLFYLTENPLILMWFLIVVFVDISEQWPVCSTRGALTGLFLFSVPARSHVILYYIISVEHVLRPGSHDILYYIILYYILYYIILYFNSPRRIKSKEFLQFIFFHSPHRPKPKDFLQCNFFNSPHIAKPKDILQLTILIFYFEYPLNTRANLVVIFYFEYIL